MWAVSHVRFFATPWTVACQAPLSMEFSRQEYWSGLPFPAPGIEPTSFASPAWAGRFFTISSTWEDRNPSESESKSLSVMPDSLQPHGLYSPWNSPDQNTGVGSLSLLQGIFPTQGSSPGLLQCRWILYQLSYQGKPSGPPLIHLWSQKAASALNLSLDCGEGHEKGNG